MLALGRRRRVLRGSTGGGRGSPDCSMKDGGQTPNTKGVRHGKCGWQGLARGKTSTLLPQSLPYFLPYSACEHPLRALSYEEEWPLSRS